MFKKGFLHHEHFVYSDFIFSLVFGCVLGFSPFMVVPFPPFLCKMVQSPFSSSSSSVCQSSLPPPSLLIFCWFIHLTPPRGLPVTLRPLRSIQKLPSRASCDRLVSGVPSFPLIALDVPPVCHPGYHSQLLPYWFTVIPSPCYHSRS